MAVYKGKVPIEKVVAYDPNITPAKDGLTRVKTQKTTSSAKVRAPKRHVQS